MASKKEIFDALTSDSSRDGCDPDWRREILDSASPSDLAEVKRQLGRDNQTEAETEARL